MERKDMIEELKEKLEKGVENIVKGDNFKDWLDMQAKFYDYSFHNTLLILLQCPHATAIAGFKKWRNDFERNVVKGEKGIKILAPHEFTKQVQRIVFDERGFPMVNEDGTTKTEIVRQKMIGFHPVSVFDVSQTEGKELPSITIPLLTGDVENFEKIKNALHSISPVPIGYENEMGDAKGYFAPLEQRIAIKEGLSEIQEIKTTAHEIAHALAHDQTTKRIEGLDGFKERKVKEIEAEAAAYIFCQHYGIDTSDYSFNYVATWGSEPDTKLLKASMENIAKISRTMIEKVEEVMQQNQEISKEQAPQIKDDIVPNKNKKKNRIDLDMRR